MTESLLVKPKLLNLTASMLQMQTLNEGIANFYDDSSALWESMWGEHMHHGYYPKGHAPKSNSQAQIDMIEETLTWAGVKDASKASLTSPTSLTTTVHPCSRRQLLNFMLPALQQAHMSGVIRAPKQLACDHSQPCRCWTWAAALEAAAGTLPGSMVPPRPASR